MQRYANQAHRPSGDRFTVGDEWTKRGLAHDARVVTRGDIIGVDERGCAVYPRYVGRAAGAYVWDVDGNQYVDYLLGYGPVVLGHADPRVNQAVTLELANGHCIAPLWSPRQVELSEMLTSVIPGGELVHLLKTGSDATSAAVRLARIFTGRDNVIRWGYNGWHDWAAASPAGVPATTRAQTLLFDHREPNSLRAVFEQHPNDIACVLTMPFEYDCVPEGHLAELAAITREYGALFLLDEMRSGFRVSLGGAQQYFGVQADLVALSKAMANGYPISAIVGRADVLRCLAETRISSTFYAGPAEMAAALTTIEILRTTDAISHIWCLGSALQQGLREVVDQYGVPAEVVGYPPMPFLRFTATDDQLNNLLRRQFFIETTRRGVLFHPGHQWFLSSAHTAADIEFTLEACWDAMAVAMLARSPAD